MVARKAGGLTALACLAAWGCTRLAEGALPLGSRFPLAGVASGTQVVWVMRPDDYLTCQTAAGGIRELQRRAGHGVPLTVLYVGPHPAWLAEFLARQRIAATVVTIEETRFRRVFGREPRPWLYLLSHGMVRSVLPGRGYVRPAASWGALLAAADARRETGAQAAGPVRNPNRGARP
jgi:hypothetical protein